MSNKLLFHCSYGKEEAERAMLPFVAGNVAATADKKVIVFLTSEGVWLATKGYAEQVKKDGFPSLPDILKSFLANGGVIWACGVCTKPRGITEADLIEGAKIVTAANLVEELVNGAISCTL